MADPVCVCVTQPNPAGGLGGAASPPAGSGAEPRRQTHFGNNLLKIGLKSGIWVAAVYTTNCGAKNIFEIEDGEIGGGRRVRPSLGCPTGMA